MGYAAPVEKQAKNIVKMPKMNGDEAVKEIDWRKYGLVSDVVD